MTIPREAAMTTTRPAWRKSTKSTTQGGECVEVAALTNAIGLRDSKNPQVGYLALSRESFATLVRRLKDQRDEPA